MKDCETVDFEAALDMPQMDMDSDMEQEAIVIEIDMGAIIRNENAHMPSAQEDDWVNPHVRLVEKSKPEPEKEEGVVI